MQLPVPDVEGGDARGAVLEHAVGEAAGRRADVEAVEPFDVEAERLERAFELPAAAAHEALGRFDLDFGVLGHRVAGLRVRLAGDADLALAHEALGERARGGEAPRDEQFVEPDAHRARQPPLSRWIRAPSAARLPSTSS